MNQTTQDAVALPAERVLDEAALTALGLTAADTARIQEVARAAQDIAPANLMGFGKDVANKTTQFSSQLLDQVRNRDLDATGETLGEVVRIARTLNLQKLGARSRLPVVGPLIDRMRASKGELVQKFSSTNQQIEQLMRDVSRQQEDLGKRVKDFDRMHDIVVDERRELGIHVAAGRLRMASLDAERKGLDGLDDPQSRTRRSELDNAMRLLDKRVGDLVLLQHAADQSLPTIRIIQANAILLIEKFGAVRDITIPAWKRSFAIQLSLEEQKNAVELATAIDDATNEMMRNNARLLHENSVATAKANQRGVIDVETLQYVHDQLIKTVEDVRAIHREGIEKRRQAEVELTRMREDVQKRMAAPTIEGAG
ncbi:toxic anion resistance protein [Lysobacter niastensis]|uniref:Toxic anion resistance protein n=1 Tax=Lysobacter niastensis TaxID=380629 RepID=A0ABS0B646_9GAMM|nr:toxic anion resistance protein [Lysobacter niastensis]MBF6024474.1 toxic anion resistance protein [Lysobacter niastensis]